jgi:NAD-reducing hydrogenase small subunit
MDKIRFATVWLAGCSGCHMSFLDLDEWLFDLADQVEVVFSPVGCDFKEYPENVDLVLVEGAVANQENLEIIQRVRERSKILVSFGDCAVTANVPSMRNMLKGSDPVLRRAYLELGDLSPQLPAEDGTIPALLDRVIPLHEVVKVDVYLPGCPPSAERIKSALIDLLAGQQPEMVGRKMLQFG